MKHITFQYRNAAEKEWHEQVCICRTIQECKEEYRLGQGCDYKIIRVRELGKVTD